ncbi:MAG: hypothetical protein AMXMBFR34_05660 [Myxococcaceae bacterium]
MAGFEPQPEATAKKKKKRRSQSPERWGIPGSVPPRRGSGSFRRYAAFFFAPRAASTYFTPLGVICGPFAVRRA